jgi:hypothetical protein
MPAWRPVPPGIELDRVLVFKYRRKVARDHTIALGGRVLQLPRRATGAANYAGSWSRSTRPSVAPSSPGTASAAWP